MKNWDNYRFVLALDRYGTMTAAANALGVTSVTVSRHIEVATADFGHQLFRFHNSRWVATDMGKAVAKIALNIEREDARRAEVLSDTTQSLVGQVTVNTSSFINNFFLGERVQQLTQKHPGVLLSLEASDEIVSLEKGEADISVRLAEPKEMRLVRVPLCKFPISLYKSDRGSETEWVGLPEVQDNLPEMQMARAFFGKPPQIRIDSYPGVAKAARDAGMVALLPTCIASYFTRLSIFRPEETTIIRDSWCIYHEMNKGEKTVSAVVDWIKDIMGNPRVCACGRCNL